MTPDTMHADANVAPEPSTDTETEQTQPAKVWVVRADGGKYTDHFITGGYVGYMELDVSAAVNRDDIRRCYEQAFPDESPRQVARQVTQLASFLLDIHSGDYLITPEADSRRLRYGRVTGGCVSAAENDDCPYRNRRTVEWAATPLERHDFSKALRKMLGSLLTVFCVDQSDEVLGAIARLEQTDGIEVEKEDPREGATEQPFDPSKIKVRTVQVIVGQLMSRIEYGEIDLEPDFQRTSGIWDDKRKSRLIESLLLRIPIPVFYVAANEDEKWSVVDGVQRISTIYGYVTGQFPLSRLEYRKEFDGCRHDALPRAMRRRISETQFVVNVIEPGTPPEVMFNIFSRINTGGMPLKAQEIRHALNPGPIREYLKGLAQSDEFTTATDHSIKTDRMADRECVLRVLAFHMEPWEQYAGDSLDTHLVAAMRTISAMVPERRESLAVDFRKAMRAAERIFGDDAFRKRSRPQDYRKPVSMPLLEAWGVQLARCTPDEIDRLVAQREDVQARFMALVRENANFYNAISSSTGTPQRIQTRFAAIRDLVQEIL